MDNPVQIVKTNLSPGRIIGIGITLLALLAILDMAGVTNWLLYPVSTVRAKLAAKKQAE